jgi:DNA polymerase-3 subunit delta'
LDFCKKILCQDSSKNNFCSNCKSCSSFEKFSHPDISFVYPSLSDFDISVKELIFFFKKKENLSKRSWYSFLTEKYKNENFIIKKNHIFDKIDWIYSSTFISEKKILFFFLPEAMSYSVINSLLKIMEEPPSNFSFIFYSEDRSYFPETFLSRCFNFSFENIFFETEKKDNFSNFFEEYKLWMKLCFLQDFFQLKVKAEELYQKDKSYQKLFFENFIIFFKKSIDRKNEENLEDSLNEEQKIFFDKFRLSINFEKIFDFLQKLAKFREYIDQNANVKFLFIDISISLFDIFKKNELQP